MIHVKKLRTLKTARSSITVTPAKWATITLYREIAKEKCVVQSGTLHIEGFGDAAAKTVLHNDGTMGRVEVVVTEPVCVFGNESIVAIHSLQTGKTIVELMRASGEAFSVAESCSMESAGSEVPVRWPEPEALVFPG